MAIKIKIVPKKNPQDLEAAPKYYARVISTGKDTPADLATEVALNTTMGRSDIVGVLTALSEVISRHLMMGRTIELLDLCHIKPSVSSEGVATPDDFNISTHVKRISVTITPKRELVESIEKAQLERVE